MSKPSTAISHRIDSMHDLQSFYRMIARSNENGEFERLSKLGEPYRSVFLAVCTEPFLVDNFVYYYQDVLKELQQYFVYATGLISWVDFTYGYNDEFVFNVKTDESDMSNTALISKCTVTHTDAILSSAMISLMTRLADNPAPVMDDFVDDTMPNNFDGDAYDTALLDWSFAVKSYVRTFAPFLIDMVDDCILKAVFSLTGPGIKKLRKALGLTRKAFAEKFHIKLGTLTHWEQGLRQPPDHVVYMLREIARLEQKLQDVSIVPRSVLVSDCLAQYGNDHCYVVEDNFPVCLTIDDKTYPCFSVEAVEKYGNHIVASFSEKQAPWGCYLDVVIVGEV